MATLKRLQAKRSVFAGRIAEVSKAAHLANRDVQHIELFRVKYQDLKGAFDGFNELHNEIIGLIEEDDDFRTEDKIRRDTETLYYDSKMYYHKICKPLDDAAAVDQAAKLAAATAQARPAPSSQKSESLPQLNIPKFDGDLTFWPTFFDLFNQIVHFNTSLSSASKLKYLLSYLEGEPQRLINSFKISDANYVLAYDKLVKRYQNKRFLATNAMNSIMAVTCRNDSPKELRNVLNVFFESLEILKSLGFDVDPWCFILFHLLLEKTPTEIRTSFEIHYSSEEIPTFRQLYQYLENRCKAIESVQHLTAPKTNKPTSSTSNYSKISNYSRGNSITSKTSAFSLQTNNSKIQCYLCKEPHGLSKCPKFLEKSPADRNSFATQNKLCGNCLYHGHQVHACTSRFRCRVNGCNGKHHSSLHISKNSESGSSPIANQEGTANSSFTTRQFCLAFNNPTNNYVSQSTCLLATAVIDIYDGKGCFHPIRIMLDSASQSCFISEKCLRKLGLTRSSFSTTIYGLDQMSSFSSKGLTHCVIKPKNLSEPSFSFDAIVVPKVCSNLPFFDLEERNWNHLEGLQLADQTYFLSSPVDLLIGAELFGQIIREGRIVGETGQPTAIETVFGWVLLGHINSAVIPKTSNVTTSHFLSTPEIPLEITIPKFWEIEEIPNTKFVSPEDTKAEEIFQKTVSRDPTGRFIVSLPFKNGEPDLGDTYSQAFRRFSLLEKRLMKNPELYSAYKNFMQEYLDSGHMSLVPCGFQSPPLSCYLPHHCVLKPDSISTKLRVVWDGSSKSQRGISLNSTLLSGPKLQKDITSLLLIFRLHPVVFITDIVGMFRQVLVTPEHRHFQKILWRFSPDQPLSEWTLNTVTFGLTCSPYLAMRVLNELADLEKDRFPQASRLIKTQTYIDDILGTCSSVSDALSIQRELIELLKSGGFELRKWASNCPELLSAVPCADRQMPLSFDKEEPHFLKVLGLQWHPYSDCFSYQCRTSETICTKRSVLSELSKHFDPLGLLCPVILSAKCIMQQIWKASFDWDTPLPPPISESWEQLRLELPELSKISLPRRVLVDTITRCELHGFSDSSMIGYGAVVFLRVETLDSISVSLLCAKSRVAPLKTISLPKLELTAAKLLSDLISFVTDTYSDELAFDEIFAWTDSQIVLDWLKSPPSRWKTFVANRVSHIQEIVPYPSWRYIPSALNPADAASRGLSPVNLLSHALWWNGPPFLSLPRHEWYERSFSHAPDLSELEVISSEEKRAVFNVLVEIHPLDNLLGKYSNLLTIQKILSYCSRVFTNFQIRHTEEGKYYGNPTLDELQKALLWLIKHAQSAVFSNIISLIQQNKLLPKPFRKLSVFLDADGFLRVGGRLKNAPDLPFSVKHPLLLPSSHRLTTLIIEHTHKKYLHPGLKTLHNLLLQQFWILSARKVIGRTLSSCVRCFRTRPKTYAPPIMSSLPIYRITQLKPFSYVALDFCGPFWVTPMRHRGAKKLKSYACVMVCTATTAVHLELTVDLSTESFIAAFRRFIARRGTVVFCQSDNGTNFVGAYNQLFELAKQASEKLYLKWKFSPPTGPHFNGLAEAGVKSLKTHLVRVVGEQIFSYEEMSTLLCEIEAVLNSRPLCSQSSDPNDLIPLTPSHFLTLGPLLPIIPEPDLSEIAIARLSRWQLIQKLQSDFWKRYSLEYLNTLQQRLKWVNPVEEVKLNDLVLIKHETTSPLKWPLGRVVQLHPGADGHVRVVTVKTQNGQLRRPVIKLCPLPTT